jgi:hypothetical protein
MLFAAGKTLFRIKFNEEVRTEPDFDPSTQEVKAMKGNCL